MYSVHGHLRIPNRVVYLDSISVWYVCMFGIRFEYVSSLSLLSGVLPSALRFALASPFRKSTPPVPTTISVAMLDLCRGGVDSARSILQNGVKLNPHSADIAREVWGRQFVFFIPTLWIFYACFCSVFLDS